YSFFDPRAWASRRSTPVTGVRADAVPADTSSAAAAGVSSTAAIAGVGTTGAGVPVVWGRVVVDAAAVPLIVVVPPAKCGGRSRTVCSWYLPAAGLNTAPNAPSRMLATLRRVAGRRPAPQAPPQAT